MKITTTYDRKQNYIQQLFGWVKKTTLNKKGWYMYSTLTKPYDWERF